jgi:copper chaperone CopZ
MTMMKSAILVMITMMMSVPALRAEDQAVIRVDGLACPFCAYGLEKKIGQMEGVADYDVDLKTGNVILGLSENSKLNLQDVKAAVKESGFTFKSMQILRDGKVIKDVQGKVN